MSTTTYTRTSFQFGTMLASMAAPTISTVTNIPDSSLPQVLPTRSTGVSSPRTAAAASSAVPPVSTSSSTINFTPPLDSGGHSSRSSSPRSSTNDSSAAVAISPTLSTSANTSTNSACTAAETEVDEAILQALRSPKERLWTLKLGETMENLIHERSPAKPYPRATLYPTSSYQRLLIHRCSAYHRLTPEVETANKAISIIATTESRIPSRRILELVPMEQTSNLPTFKIMRRATPEQRNKSRQGVLPTPPNPPPVPDILSPTESVTVDSPLVSGDNPGVPEVHNDEDADAAILKALGLPGSKSNPASAGTNTPRKTFEEREAAYAEARNRIFMDFEEKDKMAQKLREDREREREAREMHRALAEEDDVNALVPESIPSNGASVSGRPQSTTADHDGPLRPVNGFGSGPQSKLRERSALPRSKSPPYPSINGNGPTPGDSPALPTSDPAASLVSYPTLYEPDPNQDNRGLPPAGNQPFPLDPSASYDPSGHPFPQQPPFVGNPYAQYPITMTTPPMNGPSMNGGPSMIPPNYPPYASGPPNQQQGIPPHIQVNPGMMGTVPYQYFPSAPPNHPWQEGQGGYPVPGGLEGQNPMAENRYGVYPSPVQQPQPPQFWPSQPPPPHPPHLQAQGQLTQPPELSPPSTYPYPPNGHPNAANYPPHFPFYNPNMQQQAPYQQHPQHPQHPQYPIPPPNQYPQQPHQFNMNQHQRVPPQQPQRQLWSPSNGKRESHDRSKFSNGGQHRGDRGGHRLGPHSQGPHHSVAMGIPMNGNQRTPVGPRNGGPRDGHQNNREIGHGPASLIATPMSGGPAPHVKSRSRNSSISATSAIGVPLGIGSPRGLWNYSSPPDGIPPGGGRGGGSIPLGPPFGPGVRLGIGDRGRGSASENTSESVSNAGESGARTPLDETASIASSSMSSTSSTRTFTSTSSKHPSLPARPDWAIGLIPGPMHSTSSPASGSSRSSAHGNHRSGSSSSSSNPTHSRTQSFQSHGRPSPYSNFQAQDFPPLPGSSSGPVGLSPQRPVMGAAGSNTAWTGNNKNAFIPAPELGSPFIPQGVGMLPHEAVDLQIPAPLPAARFGEHDGKYPRPPPKPSASLFDPKQGGRSGRASTPVGGRASATPIESGGEDTEEERKIESPDVTLSRNMARLQVVDGSASFGIPPSATATAV
ncbi:hypothetical protein FRB99_000988 [Tulasnella sp. 403]|nr:hypothetical protein FRB99_000988 [Tulasnella sp. 403]